MFPEIRPLRLPPRGLSCARGSTKGTGLMKLTTRLCAGTALTAVALTTLPSNSFAEDKTYVLPPIIASASRLDAGLTSSSVTVVDRQAIARHPGMTLPEVLAAEAGLHVRDFYGNGASSFSTVDVRGFGEQATQNTLILVDGRRINDLDLSGVQFSAVPRGSIERIEVVRGAAAAVLYGEGAVGGAINIVTRRSGEPQPGVKASGTVGGNEYRRSQASFSFGGTPAFVEFAADITDSGGWRHNSEQTRHAYSAGLTIDTGPTVWRASAAYNTDETGLPGGRLVDSGIGLDRVNNDPRGTATPRDKAEERGVRFEAGVETRLGEGTKLLLDGGYRRSSTSSDFISQATLDDRTVATASLTPRVTVDAVAGGLPVNAIFGVDATYTQAEVEQRFIGFPGGNDYDGWQSSVSAYGQADIGLTDDLTLDAGVRAIRTDVKLDSIQNVAAGIRDTDYNVSANLGLAYAVTDNASVFVRGGRAVRVPTIDERVGTRVSPITFQPLSFDLRNQTSWDMEAGAEASFGPVDARVSVFEMRVHDQIAFDPDTSATFGFNTNLDQTRRRGVEAEAVARLGHGFTVTPRVNYTEAIFTEGPFDDNDVPAVPRLTGGLGVNWTGDNVWAGVNWRYTGSQRMLNDQGAMFPKIPTYSLVDISAGGTIGPVTLRAELRNATDTEYYAIAVASDTNPNRYSAFPLPGRTAFLEASVAF